MTDWIKPWFLGPAGIEAYQRADNYVVLDWETTNLQKGTFTNLKNSLVLGCWRVVRNGSVINKHVFGDEYCFQDLLDDIAAADFVVAHNAQFELGWLARCGLDLRKVLVFDTMTAEWVINGNIRVDYSLEGTATRYGFDGKESIVSKLIKFGVCPSTIPRSWLLRYCNVDVDQTHQVFLKQINKITQLDLWHIALSRNLIIPVLTDMTMNGLELDINSVQKERERQQLVYDELGDELDKITGGINLNSPKQLSTFLYDKLRFRKLVDKRSKEVISSTGQDVVSQLVSTNDTQSKFLELYKQYNKASSLLSKTLNYLGKVCEQMNGRFYGAIVQCRTETHRLAGSGIGVVFDGDKKESKFQLQNIPRAYKYFFTAHQDDWEVMEFDGAGMEFRIAAILGRDKQAEFDIVNGTDIHAFTRDTINAWHETNNSPVRIERQDAKSVTFTPLYWGNGTDEAEQLYAKAFAEKYSGIREEQQRWIDEVINTKQLVTPYGMRYYWPNVKMYKSGWVSATNNIVNFPIQGLATAECIPISMVHFWHRTAALRAQLFNTVHDSGVCRFHVDDKDAVMQHAKEAMTSDVYFFLEEVYGYDTGTCPLGVGFKCGKNWGKADEEIIFDVWKDGNERMTIEKNKVKTVVYDTRQEQ